MTDEHDTGLGEDQVAQLRAELVAGRRPRVRVSGAQFPPATMGTVLRVGDPDADGSDFITVRVKAGGVTDELGFAPKELSMPGRGRRRAPVRLSPPVPPRAAEKPIEKPKVAAAVEPRAARSRRAAGGETGAAAPAPVIASRRAPSVPAVTITVASEGSSWSVTAQRGARVIAKKAPLTPGTVAAVVALLDQPAVEEAVAAVNDTALREAEAHAEKLRAELAQVEAVLSSHRRP